MDKGIAKKYLGWLAACVAALGTVASAWADKVTVYGVEWSYTEDGESATIVADSATGYRYLTGAVAIPETLGGYPVTAIGDGAFSSCYGLTGITIPDSVKSIGTQAFAGCSGLTSLTIPNSVTNIGPAAFSSCTGLTSMAIPDSVTRIESSMFASCTGLASVTIPSSVTHIGNQAFIYCSALAGLTVPDSVETIEWYGFYGSGLQTLSVPGTWEGTGKLGNAMVSEGCAVVYRGHLDVTTAALPAATELVAYEKSLEAEGWSGSCSWRAVGSPGLPEGVELTSAGVLRGTPQEAGIFAFTAEVEDTSGGTGCRRLTLEVAENPAVRPTLVSASPRQGYVNLKTAATKKLSVKATHPAGETLSYAWSVDGVSVSGTKTNYTYRKADTRLHTVRCTVSGANLPRTATAEWKVGVLTVDGPEDATVSLGQRIALRAEVTSSLTATVKWYDGAGNTVGSSETLVLDNPTETAQYHAEATSAMGTVTGRTATVTVVATPSVGRIHKLTGAAFEGNRLVLRAKAYGDLEGAAWSWKRDGMEVATTERLDIASLGAGDFGTYMLTVTTPHGTATSAGYALEPAPEGVPAGWGYDSAGNTVAPEGLSGVVQVTGGNYFSLALRNDGTVAAWGGNDYGECNVPTGLSGVSQVAASKNLGAGFALKKDGTVAAWGKTCLVVSNWNDYAHSEYNPETGTYTYTGDWVISYMGTDLVGTVPVGLSNVVKISIGSMCALALTADGDVVSWGEDIGIRSEGLADVVDIAAGTEWALALLADGSVRALSTYAYLFPNEPPVLADPVAVSVSGNIAFALSADGTLSAWMLGTGQDYYGLSAVPATDAEYTAVDGGSSYAMALDAAGRVVTWGQNWYPVPDWLLGSALGIGAGVNHCLALVVDTDGDSVPDALEARHGRNPEVWEPWEKVSVGGKVMVDGAIPPEGGAVTLLDAEGNRIGRTVPDATGAWSIGGVLPGRYTVEVKAEGAADARAEVSTLDGRPAVLDLALEPGEAAPLAAVVPHRTADGLCNGAACAEVAMPSGTAVYLDMWPVKPGRDGTINLGETSGLPSPLDGTLLLPHAVTVKSPEAGTQTPAPAWLDGEEARTVEANPHFTAASGSMRVTSTPDGVEVWVDYADEPLGVTPLEVTGLSAYASHSHILLLKKDGYLRPRPIQFRVEAGARTDIEVPLAASGSPQMLVAVSSALPGMDIYLDYLPTAQVTPGTGSEWVWGLDPASYEGRLWYSAPHSILLKHDRLRPFAPRAVPEDGVLSITAPNTYDDSDGDGMRNDREVADGSDPFDSTAATVETPVPVPHAWLDAHPAALAAAGGDYEAAALADYDKDGMEDWKEYVAGSNPEDPEDYFRVTVLKHEGGEWKVEFTPPADGTRTYQLEAAPSADGEYAPVAGGGDEPRQRFYRVGISLK